MLNYGLIPRGWPRYHRPDFRSGVQGLPWGLTPFIKYQFCDSLMLDMKTKFSHKPVMLDEVLFAFEYLSKLKNAIFVDGTLGLGGHASAIADELKVKSLAYRQAGEKNKVIGIDKDEAALNTAGLRIKNKKLNKYFTLVRDDFSNIKKILAELDIEKVDGILLDLGVSSMQLDDKSRGFSFEDKDQLLDMRMDKTQHKDAEYILNNYPKHDLENVLRGGEEKFYKKIALNVIEKRKKSRIKTVGELLDIISAVYPMKLKAKKTNFATDTFRALRLEVNDEISNLDRSIQDMIDILEVGGRLAIISFHSLEDRIVKHKFRALENPCICPPKQPYCTCGKKPSIKILTKKPIIPSDEEIAENSRARSAKLRIAQKV